MSLPIDRTTLLAAQSNQVPNFVISSQKNINAITTVFDGVDEVYNYVTGLISAGTLSRLGILNVKDYGAKGDGVSNDYSAILSAAAVINAAGTGTLYFPPGTYYINEYKTASNGVLDIIYRNCNGLNLLGYGATIKLNGTFNRTTTSDATVIPFKIIGCNNVSIEGFTVNGSVVDMTKTPALLGEGDSYGISLWGTTKISIKNVTANYFATDGIYIRDGEVTNPRICSKQVYMENVVCQYNARQGMSIIQLRGGTFVNCNFSFTGQAPGAYGVHSPTAGIDVEPNRSTATASPNQMDFNTGDLEFINCICTDNLGQQFIAGSYSTSDHVTIRGGEYKVGLQDTFSVHGMTMDVPDGVIHDCLIDMGSRRFYLGFDGSSTANLTLTDSVIKGTSRGLMSTVQVRAYVKNNRFIGTHTVSTNTFFPYLQNAKMKFEDNYIYIPQEANDGTAQQISIVQTESSLRNKYETNLVSGGSNYFYNSYAAATLVQDEKYLSGSNFRHTSGTTYDYANPYGSGTTILGQRFRMRRDDNQNTFREFMWRNAAPTTGTAQVGDVCFNSAATLGGIGFWECTTAGTPGTWTPHQIGVLTSIAATPLGIGFHAFSGGQMYISVGTSSAADWKQIT